MGGSSEISLDTLMAIRQKVNYKILIVAHYVTIPMTVMVA